MSHLTADALNRNQKQLVGVIWGTYALFYLGRVNLSPALGALATTLGKSRAEVGAIGTAFFWAYAIGQLVNGELGNRLRPRWMVASGLGVIALANILFGFQNALPMMVLLWAINGFAHSSGWGPMLRVLSERLTAAQNRRISIVVSLSYQFGTSLSWIVAGILIATGGWRLAFWVPGLILLGVLVFWWITGVDAVQDRPIDRKFRLQDLWKNVNQLWPVLLGAVFMGIVQTGSLIWMPTYFTDTGFLPSVLVGSLTAIVPLLGAVGMIFAGTLLAYFHDPLKVMKSFLFATTIAAGCAAISAGYIQVLFITVLMLFLGGSSALLLGSIPLLLAPSGRTSSVAGTITAIQNIGGGLSGVLVGGMIDLAGWKGVFGLWACCALVALVLMWLIRNQPQVPNLSHGVE